MCCASCAWTVLVAATATAAFPEAFDIRMAACVQELIDIEDETWWLVRRCDTADTDAVGAGGNCKLSQGWVPEELVSVLACRPLGTSMVAGTEDWCNALQGGELEGSVTLGGDIGLYADGDREVAKLLAYRQIIDRRRSEKGIPTSLFLAEELLDHPATHIVAFLCLVVHFCAALRLRPSLLQTTVGFLLGFIAVDLLSTIYHLCLDYALLSTNTVTVTDLHHKLPLNYNLFSPRKLVATSYVAVIPMHAAHLSLHGAIWLLGWNQPPILVVYSCVAATLGCSCGFVHNAAHRRRHNLPIASCVRFLQDIGVLLHPDVHSAHHRCAHDRNFSLFSGVTHPFTDRLLQLAWTHGWLPLTPETHRVNLS